MTQLKQAALVADALKHEETHDLSGAERGEILLAVQQDPDDDEQAAVTDCIADLICLCKARGIPFEVALAQARAWAKAECLRKAEGIPFEAED